jgi:hypothetical protein
MRPWGALVFRLKGDNSFRSKVAKYLGDGLMAIFGYPAAYGNRP